MKRPTVNHPSAMLAAVILLIVAMITPVDAQWWRFGTDASEPVFTELLFNKISLVNPDRIVQFTREDLDNGEVMVQGRVEIGQGNVGRVEASLDGGTTWEAIPFNSRGIFAFKFTPELERTYHFRARALSTSGQVSDETANSFDFRVVESDNRSLVQETFAELIRTYSARDRSGFMALVSHDFVGSEMALDSALSNDFRYFDSIRIRPTIQRMAQLGDRWMIYFSFNRQVRSVRSGQLLQDQANTTLTLIREGEGFKLHEMAAPLIFGLSDPSNVATFVTDESIGKEVIVVDDEGNVSTSEQGQTVESAPPSNIIEGTVSLSGQGYSFARRQVTAQYNLNTAFIHEGNILFWGDETLEFKELHGYSSLAAIDSISGDGWQSALGESSDAAIGKIYALKLANNTYALIRLASGTDDGGGWLNPAVYQFRHQLNGTPNF